MNKDHSMILRLLVAGSTAEQRLLLLRARWIHRHHFQQWHHVASISEIIIAQRRQAGGREKGSCRGLFWMDEDFHQWWRQWLWLLFSADDDFDMNLGGEEKDQRNGNVEQLLYHWKDRGKGIVLANLPCRSQNSRRPPCGANTQIFLPMEWNPCCAG